MANLIKMTKQMYLKL